MNRATLCATVMLIVLLPRAAADPEDAGDGPRPEYHLRAAVMASGGAPGHSGPHRSVGTCGQPTPIGVGAAAGFTLYAGFWRQRCLLPSGIDTFRPGTLTTALMGSSPNPFRNATQIRYALGSPASVQLVILDVTGRCVRNLVAGQSPPGFYTARWDGRGPGGIILPSGPYFYRLSSGSYIATRRLLLIR